jgi:anti-sigma factor RsiW
MNHEEQVILYAAHQLDESERAHFEKHLADCVECQADLQLWKTVAEEIVASDAVEAAPAPLAERALEQIHSTGALVMSPPRCSAAAFANLFRPTRDAATAAVMALGVVVALISRHAEFIYHCSAHRGREPQPALWTGT